MKHFLGVLLVILMLFLPGCGYGSTEYNEILINCLPNEGQPLQKDYTFPEEVFEGTPDSDYEPIKISTYPDKNIDIYGIYEITENKYKIVIVWENCSRQFAVTYIGTGGVSLQSSVTDVDQDGEDELLLIEFLGSGTGVSVERLHIIEKNGKSLSMCSLSAESYIEKTRELICERTNLRTRTIQIGKETIALPDHIDITRFALGNIVSFELIDSRIYMRMAVQYLPKEAQFHRVSDYAIQLVTEVAFEEQTFLLGKFEASEISS